MHWRSCWLPSCVCILHGRDAVRLSGETAGNCAYTLHIDTGQHAARAPLMRQSMLSSFLRLPLNVYSDKSQRSLNTFPRFFV